MTYLKNRKNAFVYAFSGLWQSFMKEAHMKIHLLAAILVISAGFYFGISKWDWVCILGCITMVISFELINTALENLCDMVTREQHPTIKYIKDISAAAVLLICVFSAVVGLFIFGPYLARLF